ncbi:MAG TPA: carboxypeptidase regulatory-like domain-containing protein [Thermoanaerobaculia bacterium]|nr:carboxypeptidase regulatory-like domain-containing protein [Thermoanaerobaculia bacterium]
MNRTRALIRFLGIFAVAAAISVPLAAQSATGSLTGNVVDGSGAGIPGVTVTATSAETGASRNTTSGTTGNFTIPLLSPGMYTVAAELSGFSPARVANVVVSVGGQEKLTLRMDIAKVSEAVTVAGEAPLIEATRSDVSSTVNQRAIQNLPANGRNFIDFVLTTPGVVKDNFRVGDIVFAGQRGTLNSLVVDGGDNNNTFFGQALGRTGTGRAPYQFSQEAVKEFQVNSNAYSAEYGRAGGAVINVVTRSGSNDFHGGAFYYYRDKKLNAKDYTDAVAGRAKSPYHFDQFGATVGGPIVRDRVFFFANYDGQRNQTPNTVIFPPTGATVPSDPASQAGFAKAQALAGSWNRKQDQDVYLAKFDAEIFSNAHATLRYNRQNFTGVGFESGGGNVAFEHTGDSLVKTDTFAGSVTSSFTSSLFNEIRGQWAKDSEPGTANSSNPEVIIQQGGVTWLQAGENFFSPRETTIKRYQIADTATYLVGNHTVKGGVDYLHDDILNYFPGNFFGSYTFASLASFNRGIPDSAGERYVQAFAGPGTSGATTNPNTRDLALFAQDEYRVMTNLTFNLGVRYDRQFIAQPTVLNTDSQLIAAGLFTDRIPEDKNNVGVRVGFAWSPTKDDRTLLKGGYGIFYGRTPAIMIGTAHSNNGINVQTLTFTGASVPTYPARFTTPPTGGTAAVPTILLFDPNFRSPKTQQASVGVERVLTNDLAVSLNYLYVKGSDLPRSTDVNLGAPVDTTVPIQGDGTSASFQRFSSARPFTHFGRVIEFQSSANSQYNGITLEVNKRFSQNWQGRIAYTYGKAKDNKSDATAVVPQGSDDSKFASDPLGFARDWGPADNDVRHRIVASGVWTVNYGEGSSNGFVRALASGWTVAGIVAFQTGMPYSLEVNGDLNNDQNTRNDLVPGTQRNSQRLPSTLSVDPRISRHIPLGPVDLELIVEAFNVFNAKNVVGLQSTQYRTVNVGGVTQLQPVASFLTPCAGGQGCTAQAPLTSSTGPRILQVAGRVTF